MLYRKKIVYRRCSNGTRSASSWSHCLAKWFTHRMHANTRDALLSLPRKHGKCIACEFMCSALVDSHSNWLNANWPLQMEHLKNDQHDHRFWYVAFVNVWVSISLTDNCHAHSLRLAASTVYLAGNPFLCHDPCSTPNALSLFRMALEKKLN